jgi:FAD/FMN-containing dehydrogenase
MDSLKLSTLFHGKVSTPGDADYDAMRQVFYGGIDKKPAIIVRPLNAEDVQRAIALARDQNLELAVRSGGHSPSGFSTTDGGVVIDLRDMHAIEIDQANKTVWAEAGLTAGELTHALDEHNFVLGFGDTGSVGIGGITLGGGVGFLARKFGLAIDNLLAAEIVTADGKILQVDKDNYSDLFWAIRGGGGNFGVVTKFKYALHGLSDCYGGMLLLPATPDVIAGFTQLAKDAPEELSTIVNIMPAFPAPFIPEQFHGKLSMMVLAVYAGDPKDAEKTFAPIRALAEPIVDMLKPMRYKDIFMPENGDYHPTAVSTNLFMEDIDRDSAVNILDQLERMDAPMRAFQFRVLGGAVARVADSETAYAHRKNAIMGNVACFYEAPEQKLSRQAWVDEFAASLRGDNAEAYVNFVTDTEADKALNVYPEQTLVKLREVKAAYDPMNLFKKNFNILPKE